MRRGCDLSLDIKKPEVHKSEKTEHYIRRTLLPDFTKYHHSPPNIISISYMLIFMDKWTSPVGTLVIYGRYTGDVSDICIIFNIKRV